MLEFIGTPFFTKYSGVINKLTYVKPTWSAAAYCRFHSAQLAWHRGARVPSAQQAAVNQSASKLAHSK